MSTIFIATRGSALALAQASTVLADCRRLFPNRQFDLNVIKTTGDKLQTITAENIPAATPKGLFTKELETALLDGSADFAVHSLKDLPTDLPPGLALASVAGVRADVRDVFIHKVEKYRAPKTKLAGFPAGLSVATGSARRSTQLLALRPDFQTVEIRGNVPTRLQKLAAQPEIQATVLAAAGLGRLHINIGTDGELQGERIPRGLFALIFEPEEMLPCVGQGAIGLEARENDARTAEICQKLNSPDTLDCVTAERSFLRAMGGGCQTPIGAYACLVGGNIYLRAVAHLTKNVQRAEATAPRTEAVALGQHVAAQIKK